MNTDSEDRIMIAELERIIQAEEAKPEGERDLALIDDCIKEIAEIKGVKAEFSEEEVAQITDKLIQTAEKTKKRKRFVRLVAGIAAMFVIVTGVTACAVNPALIDWLQRIVRLPVGSVYDNRSVTYVHHNTTEEYNSIDELVKSKIMGIYYPYILPKDVNIEYVEIVNNGNTDIICFQMNTERIHYTIHLDYYDPIWKEDENTILESNGAKFYVYIDDNQYIAHAEIDGNAYIIQTSNMDEMILIVGGIKKE